MSRPTARAAAGRTGPAGRGERAPDARLVALALALVTCFVYLPSVGNDFVNWDDDGYVTQNPRVQRFTFENIRWAFTAYHQANWHPLTWLSHMADSSLCGLDPRGHHVTNILLHAANAALLLLILHRLTHEFFPSLLVAAMFALHPLNVEAVAWVAARKTVLSTLLWLLVIAGYVRYVARPSVARYGAVVVLFALGLMAKPMLVTLPLALLLLDVWPLRRFSRHAVIEKLPLLLLTAASSVVTIAAARAGDAHASTTVLPLSVRLSNAAVAYARYLENIVVPSRLSAFYPMPGTVGAPRLSAVAIAGAAIVLAAITIAAVRVRRRAPHVLVGWLWFLGTLVPVIGLSQAGSQAMADRFAYVPIIGILVAVAWSVPGARRWPPPITVSAAAAIVLCILGALAVKRERVWRDSESLWRATLSGNPRCVVARLNYGHWLTLQGRSDEAIAQFKALLTVAPHYPMAHANLGAALQKSGRHADAVVALTAAVAEDPDDAESFYTMGLSRSILGQHEAAIDAFAETLRRKPDHNRARYLLARALADGGRLDEATAHFRAALVAEPDAAEIRSSLALVLAQGGDLGGALQELRAALRSRPDFPEAHNNMGMILMMRGETDAAERAFRNAARLRPDFGLALMNLGDLFARTGRTEEAAQVLREAHARASAAGDTLLARQIDARRRAL